MKIQTCAALLAVLLIAPSASARGGEAAALRSHCDAGLESLRAGRTVAPAQLPAVERAELRSAESCSPDLLEMRAGELTDREWTMVAVGLVIVVIILLI
jgi:hypothetical protein